MRILLTSPFPLRPAVSGGAVRTLSIARALAGLGHAVTILSPDAGGTPPERGVDWVGYRQRHRTGYFVSLDFARTLSDSLGSRPDLAVVAYPYQALMTVPLFLRSGVPFAYDAHNVERERFRQTSNPLLATLVGATERLLCRYATHVFTVSPGEQALVRACYGRASILLPNGVDTGRFTPGPPSPELLARYALADRRVVLYVGSYSYRPNLEALRFLLGAWPGVTARWPDARLLVVGRHPPDWARGKDAVLVTDVVDDIVSHIRLAHVVAVPVVSGGGTRLKILEALACGQTVLSTPFGALGIEERAGPALRLAPLEAFARTLHELLEPPPVRGGNGQGRELAGRYDWSRLVGRLDWPGLAGVTGG